MDSSPRPSGGPEAGTPGFRHPGAAGARLPEATPRPSPGLGRLDQGLTQPPTAPLPATLGRVASAPERTATTAAPAPATEGIDRIAPIAKPEETPRAHVVGPAPAPDQTVRRIARIPVRSTFRVSIVFYLLLLVLWLILGSILYLVLESAGAVENIESFFGEILGYKDVNFHFGQALLFFTVAGLAWVLVASVWSAFLAFVYNRTTRFVGGLRIVIEDDAPRS